MTVFYSGNTREGLLFSKREQINQRLFIIIKVLPRAVASPPQRELAWGQPGLLVDQTAGVSL